MTKFPTELPISYNHAMLDKVYSPQAVEKKWVDAWKAAELFRCESSGDPRNAYTIVIPPPNVTGALHIGHALNNTLQDILIRYHRLIGRAACWVPGTDHGGIATQNVMEKQLKAKGQARHDLGRAKFLELMQAWTKDCKKTILGQLERLGCALDNRREAFTMDEARAKAVVYAFERFWRDGFVYRGERMVNWCVRCSTALSDIEVEYEERNGALWHIRYPVEGETGRFITVATTRPETMLGDTAVAVNPADTRYKDMVGRKLRLPLTERTIPLVADEHVDSSFGTGALKVTPAHDPNDFEIWQRHKSRMQGPVAVIDFQGRMSASAGSYAGLTREEARKRVAADIQGQGLLEKEEDHRHSVGVCYRCGQAVEPLLSEQWFMKMEPLAAKAREALAREEFRIYPDSWEGPYRSWLENIRDWCLSRQIWWGHRIPVWYCGHCLGDGIRVFWPDKDAKREAGGFSSLRHLLEDDGIPLRDVEAFAKHVTVSGVKTEAGAPMPGLSVQADRPGPCPKCGKGDWIQDPDVLDTWFSSALWPMSVFGWPEETRDLRFFYPTSVLVTGYEILYLWVARMQMMGLYFRGRAPFAHALIHGIVRDKSGKKMSKSLGNVVDPLVMMDAHGTDAFRFSLARQAYPGKDMPYAEDSIRGPRNFANKIWNSTRFVLMNMPVRGAQGTGRHEEFKPAADLDGLANVLEVTAKGRVPERGWELSDYWIVAEFNRMHAEFRRKIERYEIASAADEVYGFLWDKFCDWYIELAKLRLGGPEGASKLAAQDILVGVLAHTLKLLHPFMPYITEELYQELKPYTGECARFLLESKLPEPRPQDSYAMDPAPMASVMEAVTAIRAVRSQLNVPPGLKINALYAARDQRKAEILVDQSSYIIHLARLEALEPASSGRPPQSATVVAAGVTLYVPLVGLIDLEKEKSRLGKELERLTAESARCEAQLSNGSFIERAPESEVSKIRQRSQELRGQHQSLLDTLRSLNGV